MTEQARPRQLSILAARSIWDTVLVIGRCLVAVGFIGLGVEHFVFQRFVTGRAPDWPASLPGAVIGAYLSGAVIVATGVAILIRRHARFLAVLAGLMILLWAFLRQVPVVLTDTAFAPTWTMAGKALTFFGGAWAVAGTSPPMEVGRNALVSRLVNPRGGFITLGRICLGIFMIVTGIQHFIYTPFVASLIPGWFPGDPVLWTRFAGVALIAGGAGLQLPRTAPLAALLAGLMVFSWVWIVHVPRTLGAVTDKIAVFEAVAVSGIAFVLAGFLLRNRSGGSPSTEMFHG